MTRIESRTMNGRGVGMFGVLCLVMLLGCGAACGQASFEVATVKVAAPGDAANGSWSLPGTGRFSAKGLTMAWLIRLAYGINDEQIAGKPAWLETDVFDVNAKPEEGVKLTREELQPRLQRLLQERFRLQAHFETHEAKGYALVVAKGGPKLTATQGTTSPGWRVEVHAGHVEGKNWSMANLAKELSPLAGATVVDRTGLAGSYDLRMVYAADSEKESTLPSLFTALRETLGLQLDAQKVPVEMLVIDHLERVPTEN